LVGNKLVCELRHGLKIEPRMKTFRSILFWMHLAAGAFASVVVLMMSVTGVALTYEKQMLEWADRNAWTASAYGPAESSEDLRRELAGEASGREGGPSPADATPLSPETLLARVSVAQPGTAPLSVTLRADPFAPATVTLADNKALLVDPYSGGIIGPPPAGLRRFFRTMTSWHRYLAQDGASRATGKSITGAANLAFLFIVISGLYLWLPRLWTWLQFKNVLWFRSGLTPKARDFNWHNVIGVWTAIPLAIVVAGAVPISYPWASNLVYRLAGDTPPPPAAANTPARTGDRSPVMYVSGGVDAAWAASQAQVPAWRTITTRLATSATAPVTISVDEGYAGQPQLRTTFTFERATGSLQKAENFQSLSAGRQWRSWLRFAHTGEIYGLTGQTVAGLASAGAVVLVYTGLALALRRLAAWITRRRNRHRELAQQQRAA
jgi:uncharacterized iron-regulated membrane protein